LIELRSSDFLALSLDINIGFYVGVPFHYKELSETSPSLVNCRLGEDDVSGLNAAHYQVSYSPIGDLSGD
jgi:hypothetical protein